MAEYALGDSSAFKELYRRYGRKVFGYLKKSVGNHEQAEELYQQAFLRLHHSRKRYKAGSSFPAWFYTICRHLIIDHWRKNRERNLLVPLDPDFAGPSVNQTFEVSKELLAKLSSEQREALHLRYREDLDFEEIAAQLKTSSANARQIVSRAVRRLRILVGREDDNSDESA